MLKSKKGAQQMWWIIAAAILAILVVIFMLVWFKGSGGRAFEEIEEKIGGLSDCDKDNVADMFDKCPCFAGSSKAELDGCPTTVTEENKEQMKEYTIKINDPECPCKKNE